MKPKWQSNRLHQQKQIKRVSECDMPGNHGQGRQLTAQGKAHQASAQEISAPHFVLDVSGKPWKAPRVRLVTTDVGKHILSSAVTSVKSLVWARAGVWEQGYIIQPCIKGDDTLHPSSIFHLRFSNSGTCNAPVIISHLAPGNEITADWYLFPSLTVSSLLLSCKSVSLEGYVI